MNKNSAENFHVLAICYCFVSYLIFVNQFLLTNKSVRQ